MTDPRPRSRVLAGPAETRRAFVDPAEAESGRTSPIALAYEKGRLEGLEAGAAEARAALAADADALRRGISEALDSLVGLRDRTTRQHEEAMFELGLAAASRMLREKIDRGDPVASRALQEALSALPESGPVTARLHPEDIESVRRDLAREIDSGRVGLTADETIRRGGCVVDSDAGAIDATVEAASALVAEAARGTGAS